MSTNRSRRQSPAQRAAAERRAAAVTRPATTVLANETSSITLSPPRSARQDDIFDLDAVVHEGAGERFRFKAGGRVWELLTPEEVDWQENSALSERATGSEDLRPILRLLLAGQYEDFLDLTVSVAQVGALIEQWREWHGIEVGESGASPRS